MEEQPSFVAVLDHLKRIANSRDPRAVRLAAVTSALSDVVDGDLTAAKVYASTVATLEGTLHQQHEKVGAVVESMSTQVALLELLRLALQHVAPATLAATIVPTSRVVRSVVTSCLCIAPDDTHGMLLETKDGLGAISSVLMSSSKAGSEFLRHLPAQVDEKSVRQLLNSTLLGLFHDSRPRVKKTAMNELCGLLNMPSSSRPIGVVSIMNHYVLNKLKSFGTKSPTQKKSEELLDVLGFLQTSIMSLDFTSIGTRLMEMLLNLFYECSSLSSNQPMFVSNSIDITRQILMINAILSTILAMLENDVLDSKIEKELDFFSARVLASLVQIESTLTFKSGSVEDELVESGSTIFGQVMLSAAQRLLAGSDFKTGCKLLPLMIQRVVKLCQVQMDSSGQGIADTMLPELSQLFRVQLQRLKKLDPEQHDRCCSDCLVAMQVILQPSFQQTWRVSLKALAILLQQMNHGDIAVKSCVHSLFKLHSSAAKEWVDDAFDDAVSSLIQGMGIELFWNQMELTSIFLSADTQGSSLNFELPWILKMLKVSGSFSENTRLNLSFFQENVLPLARHFDTLSAKNPAKVSFYKNLVLDLWALFPCFCRHPADVDSSFASLAPILVRAMNDERYPHLVVVICGGLQVLATGILDRFRAFEELVEEVEALEARRDAGVLERFSEKLLPALFKLVDGLRDPAASRERQSNADGGNDEATSPLTSHGAAKTSAQVQAATQAIASLAQLASKTLIQNLFSKLVQRLLEASQAEEDLSEKMCSLLSLSQALIISENLDESSLSLLYRSLRPLIRTDETTPRVQKRAYKVLAEICIRYPTFVTESSRLKELLDLLTASSATSQISARYMRIKCLHNIVNAIDGSVEVNEGTLSTLLGETLLCLKDSNTRTREAASLLLLSLAELFTDPAEFLQSVMAAVASKTTNMRSAAVIALSRLVFEYARGDPSVRDLLPSLVTTVLLLSDDPSREVTKSLVGFIRVAVSALSPEQLEPLLPEILNGLMKYHRGKDRFRAKIKIIIKKLVKLFGYDALMPLIPQSDVRLLTHMRKLSEREVRRKRTLGMLRNAKQTESHFDEMIASDEEDSDDGKTLQTAATKMTNGSRGLGVKRARGAIRETALKSVVSSRTSRSKVSVQVKNDVAGNVFDMTDLTKKTVHFGDTASDDSDAEGPIFDDAGKLVVVDEYSEAAATTLLPQAVSKSLAESTQRSKKHQVRRVNSLGSSYKARKAGGDVKKKGQKFDPYAYVPLDGRSYTKKNRRHAVEQMSSVVHRDRKRQKS